MKIWVDENIPLDPTWIPPGIQCRTFAGRALRAADLTDAQALLVRSITPVNEELLAKTQLTYVATATAGVDHLDTHYLAERGIAWHSAAGHNAQSVVDYVLCSLAAVNFDPRGACIGIVGCGQVGSLLYRRLLTLGAKLICYDPFLDAAAQPDLTDNLADLFEQADLVCLHTPLTRNGPHPTLNMIDSPLLERLKPDAVLISAGRGGVVCERALASALTANSGIRVVMDVWSQEPTINWQIFDKVQIGTPHIAGYSSAAKVRGAKSSWCATLDALGLERPDALQKATGRCASSIVEGADWRQALLSVYDPRVDHQALKESLASNPRGGFDLLRKNYPARAEIGEFQTRSQTLRVFGFSPMGDTSPRSSPVVPSIP